MQTAADIMSSNVYTLSESDSVKDAIELLVLENVSGAPVISDDLQVVGLVSEFDLLLAINSVGGDFLVSTIMNETPITVKEETIIEEVMDVLIINSIKRVVVVDKEDRLKGILSRHDVLAFFHTHKW